MTLLNRTNNWREEVYVSYKIYPLNLYKLARTHSRKISSIKEDDMTVTKMTLPYSPTSFRISAVVLLIGLLNLFAASNVLAVPKGPGGQSCKSSGTTTVNGKEEGTGKAMKCTADYCKYDECTGGLPPAGKCYEKTHYSNVRDCQPAARTQLPQNHIAPGQMAPLMQGQPKQLRRYAPRFQGEAIMRRGIEGEQPTKPAPDTSTESAPAQPEPVDQSSETKPE